MLGDSANSFLGTRGEIGAIEVEWVDALSAEIVAWNELLTE